MTTECCVSTFGRCCCGCLYHIDDFHHCSTVPDRNGCVCSQHKGWICFDQESKRAHSGWDEHGLCEMWAPDNTIVIKL
jgi:hypothetical protein